MKLMMTEVHATYEMAQNPIRIRTHATPSLYLDFSNTNPESKLKISGT